MFLISFSAEKHFSLSPLPGHWISIERTVYMSANRWTLLQTLIQWSYICQRLQKMIQKEERALSCSEQKMTMKHSNSISYVFPSEARPSIFSRISEKSFQDIPISYKYFFLFCSILFIFILGVLVGTLSTKYFLFQGF